MAGRNRGTAFERELEQIFAAYEKQRRARIRKVDPPTKVIGGRARFMANPWLDFVGSWTECGGRMLQIEAKTTQDPVLPLGGSRGLSEAQWQSAMDWDNAGAVVLILWGHRGEIRATTPAMAMACCRDLDRKSLRWCDALPLPRGTGWVRFDPLTWARNLTT